MHAGSPLSPPLAPSPSRLRRLKQAGFSLVEVTMSIGIIAFAFVALMGLLPVGMGVFRESIDSANETWIAQNLHSMVQVTPWANIVAEGSSKPITDEIYYFDEEGRRTDTSSDEGDEATKLRRLYAAKLLVDPVSQPGAEGESLRNARRIVAVIANVTIPKAMEEFTAIESVANLQALPARSSVKTRVFVVARMDSGN